MKKEIFKELEEKGEFINMGYFDDSYMFFMIKKEKYDKIKEDFTEENWTGY